MSIIEKAAARLQAQSDKDEASRMATASEADTSAAAPPVALPVHVSHADSVKTEVASSSPAPSTFNSLAAGKSASPRSTASPTTNKCTIDLDRLQAMGFLVPGMDRSSLAEDFRAIKWPLLTQASSLDADKKANTNLIMVTSALAGEGKSFCAINLAISIAMEMDRTVLLVDADVARPAIPKYLGVANGKGLMDILNDKTTDLSSVLQRTNIDSLTLLQAGKKLRNATEMLASQAMIELLNDIANRYQDRIIIFDSPPLLLTSEAHVLARQMGQIALVVEAEVTTQHSVKNALRQLEGCANVGLIYNKSRNFLGEGKYDDYYN